MSSCGDPQISWVRCFGVGNDRRRKGQQPLTHNKYLVFAEGVLEVEPGHEDEEDPPGNIAWKAQVVWTGSCNLSRLALRSRENAVIIRDPEIAGAYVSEWSRMTALSEPLDWTAEWVEPEWHIGS